MLKIYKLLLQPFFELITIIVGVLALALIGFLFFFKEEFTYSEFFWSTTGIDKMLDEFEVWFLTSDFPFEFVGGVILIGFLITGLMQAANEFGFISVTPSEKDGAQMKLDKEKKN